MTSKEKLAILKHNYSTKVSSPKNIKCPGTMKKRARQIRKLESCLEENI